MPNIFISYRRLDNPSIVGRIYDRLVTKFGRKAVFKDVDNIQAGEDFHTALEAALARSAVLLVVIGPNWTTVKDKDGNLRLHDPADFTRMEVEAGLAKPDCRVIPLLVGGAAMPTQNELPTALHGLLKRNARIIRDDPDFHDDMDKLIRTLLQKKQFWERLWKAVLALLFVSGGAAGAYLTSNQRPRELRQPVKFASILVIAGVVVGVASLLLQQIGIQNIATVGTNTPTVTVAADTITQAFRDDFNATVAEFGRGNCIGFTPDEAFVYGADWLFSFSDEGLVDDVPLGHDWAISPDGTMAAVSNDALYRLGEDNLRMFGIGGLPKFSADGRFLASDRIGVKEIETGRLVRDGGGVEVYTAISPDGRYVVLRQTREENAAVIDIQADARIIEDDDGNGFAEAQFSRSGRLLAIAGVGVFEIPSGRLIIESEATGTTFSPDERIIAGGQAIADTTTGETVLEFEQRVPAFFTPDSRYMALQGNGVYDLNSMTLLFNLGDTGVTVSHDGQYVASQLTGWFRLPDDELFPIDDSADDTYYYSPPLFSPDDQFVAFDGDGVYSLVSGRKVLDYPHDFVAFGARRGLILVELEEEGCALIGDSGAYTNSEPLE